MTPVSRVVAFAGAALLRIPEALQLLQAIYRRFRGR